MVVVRIIGGVGNQLFQYIYGQYLSIKFNQKVYYDISAFEKVNIERKCEIDILVPDLPIKVFGKLFFSRFRGVKNRIFLFFYKCNPHNIYISENKCLKVILSFCKNNTYYYDGYWQLPSVIEEMRGYLGDSFFLPKETIPEIIIKFEDKINQAENPVALHVRKGDYFTPKFVKTYGVCDVQYFENALSVISEKVKTYTVFVFSDDLDWAMCNLKLPSNTVFVSNSDINSYWYIYLMSICKHNIISNSSFSWWGAFLNQNPNKIVVSPKRWTLIDDKTIALENWIKI